MKRIFTNFKRTILSTSLIFICLIFYNSGAIAIPNISHTPREENNHLTTGSSEKEKMSVNSKAVQTIDGIVSEVLRIINGEKGKTRDLDAFRDLFLPTAHFTVHTHNDSLTYPVETVSLDDFIEILKDPYYDQDFEERELGKLVDEYNGIAHVFQTYHVKDADGVEETGLNSFQLINFKDRWWIVSVMWTGNSNGVEVPEKYLGMKER